MLIRFDWAMKKILRSKANFKILEGFLSELLFEDITIQKILESESNKETDDDKYNKVDLLVENATGELIIIEVQNNREWDFISRLLYGASKIITEHISKGDSYIEVKKVISVSIVYFDLGQGNDYIYKGASKFVGMHTSDELLLNDGEKKAYGKAKVEDVFPEYYIIKVNQFDESAKTPLDDWVRFLKTETIPDNTQAKGLKEAKDTLNVMQLPPEARQRYERYLENLRYEASTLGLERKLGKIEGREEGKIEGREKGKIEGREEGKIEGREEGKIEGREEGKIEGREEGTIETAKAMLIEGIPIATIAKVTGLSEEEIGKL